MKILFNLPEKVIFCKKCVLSNQKPTSIAEFKHTRNRKGAKYLNLDNKEICDACNYAEIKKRLIGKKERRSLLSY